jgi:putative Ca2+/H+ antiporter (TMEM165/GDT1 family)
MVGELIKAFFFIFMAEMGDKTQILAMTFATQYRVRKVLLGVFIGAALNHGLAVLLGVYLSSVININLIQLIAAVSFIGFGLWTLKHDDEEEEGETKGAYGPVVTVAMAFFIGELGDKTQLTAVTLATDAKYPLFILMGTVLGMIATSGIGIFVGSKLGKKIPEHTLKFASAGVFMFFGILKLFQNVPKSYLAPVNIAVFFIVLAVSIYLISKPIIQDIKSKRITPLKEAAEALYIHIQKMKEAVDTICVGVNNCKTCNDEECLIRYLKEAFEIADEMGDYSLPESMSTLPPHSNKNKKFDFEKIKEGLIASVQASIECSKNGNNNCLANKARESFEVVYLGETIPFNGDIDSYIEKISDKDENLAREIEKVIKKSS